MTTDIILPLDCLQTGEWAEVMDVAGDDAWVGRLAELGIRVGTRVHMLQGGSPCMLDVCGSRLCLRGDSLCQILVRTLDVQP